MKPAVHFVGFKHPDQDKDSRYESLARCIAPDFVHRRWDLRAWQEVMPGDVVIYTEAASADVTKPPSEFSFDDSAVV